MRDQRFAKRATAENVEILLARSIIVAGERPYSRRARGRHAVFAIGGDVAFSDIGEAMAVERGAEIAEGQRRVVVLENLVRDVRVSARREPPRLVTPEAAVTAAVVALDGEPVEEFPGLPGARVRFVLQARMQQQAVACDLKQPPAGQDVEADRRHALRRQTFGDEAQQGLAKGLGNPAVHPVADDEVERAVVRSDVVEAARAERNVGEPEPLYSRLVRRDLRGRQVDADEMRVRPSRGERNDVPARGAADLKHARRPRRRGRQPEPERGRRHSRRLLPGERRRFVRGRVVVRPRSGERFTEGGLGSGGYGRHDMRKHKTFCARRIVRPSRRQAVAPDLRSRPLSRSLRETPHRLI